MAKVTALTTLIVDGVSVAEGDSFDMEDKRLAELEMIERGLVSKVVAKPSAKSVEKSE